MEMSTWTGAAAAEKVADAAARTANETSLAIMVVLRWTTWTTNIVRIAARGHRNAACARVGAVLHGTSSDAPHFLPPEGPASFSQHCMTDSSFLVRRAARRLVA